MSDQNLFLPICGPVILLSMAFIAIWGMRARLRFSSRLRNAYRDSEKIENWLKTHRRNQTLRLWIALISILGILVLGLSVLSGVLFPSKLLIFVVGILIVLLIISGTLILIDLNKLAK
jgi:CBS domain containing-hemolysin-like protein